MAFILDVKCRYFQIFCWKIKAVVIHMGDKLIGICNGHGIFTNVYIEICKMVCIL